MDKIEIKLLESPHDIELWIEFQKILTVKDYQKGRLLELHMTKLKSTENSTEYLKLLSSVDKEFVARFIDFGGTVKEFQSIRIKIYTYGSVPKKYGAKGYKVSTGSVPFLIREGWAYLGEGNSYHYMRPNEKRENFTEIELFVPTLDELKKIAKELKSNKTSSKQFGIWKAMYKPAKEIKSTEISITLGGGIDEGWKTSSHSYISNECFEFGTILIYQKYLYWNEDDIIVENLKK